ncbi:MAG: hypothetical protein KC438_09750, partial [Thermomicrobiales bacterium]|nr:hypothetical protein [Thermomicrobiales bacterium]
DRLGILRSECRSYYRNERAHLIRRLAVHGEPMQTVSTLAYHEGLVRGRNGPDTAWSPRLRLNPFLTPVCMRANHRLPAAQRPDIRFHLDLQRRCDRSLSMLPLADAVWSEASYAHLPDATDYRRMQPLYSSSPAGRTWRLKRYADYQPLMERYLLDRDNPIHAIVDEQRLIERIGMGDANAGRTRLIWNALTAAIWMGGHERPVRLARSQNG